MAKGKKESAKDKKKRRHFAMNSLQWLRSNAFIAIIFASPVRLGLQKNLRFLLMTDYTGKYRPS